ncbi:DNA polymerase IV [Virgibacillus pantothenticus]|uniref:DNA polymerase IV n=1 Tax=Virgibacillus pantothenticus TaxID=1473 RepID=A0A0L0QPE8_VIRPA|nr:MULTISPECIES: DNA polymerase IV [Virgibacillus]API90478.1 DNA polymerase IV [Virgibacillus sp. 6R]KNE20439.1 DNA polymerase IV [Virgibacillus pantothenticus]MBS7429585.1 DNA polymerase IV [Virgibacillus sp. 19R1-5]MBU8565460.1 DNA polymerase IV [Virgibacillus pantothenticus]MBU8599760.1 DNA polymerase IV [Virgibacillus pantothenticus]
MNEAVHKQRRIIFHVDMNSFYASVEMAYNPNLKGKPLAIAGNPEERKGIVVTSSYEARAKGVKTTMNVWQAKKLCPELMVMRPNFPRYRAASKAVFKIFSEYTPLVQPVSIDEGYMDVTEMAKEVHAVDLARELQQRVLTELDLPCSIGIAPNKFLAKMASDMKKPFGLTILRKRELPTKLWPLPIGDMYGVGEKTAAKLNATGIYTIGDLAKKDVYHLKQLLGINGERLHNRANGIDNRPVDPDAIYDFKSIGNSKTLPHDTTDDKEIYTLLQELASKVEQRMKRKRTVGRSVQLMIRYHDRRTITRSKKLRYYLHDKKDILLEANDLLQKHWNLEPIRLLGITVGDLEEQQLLAKQLDLFTYENEAEKEKLYEAIEHLSSKYGKNPFIRLEDDVSEGAQQPTTSFQKDFLDDFKS